jgi:Tol biopolymer transport system component
MKQFATFIVLGLYLVSCTTKPASSTSVPTSTNQEIVQSTAISFPIPQETERATDAPTTVAANDKLLIIDELNYYMANSDGSEKVLLYSGETSRAEMASFSPSATKFAYFMNNFVYIQDLQTQNTVQVNKEIIGSMGGQIRWSPDETKLAMTCANAQQPSLAVCLIKTLNGQIEILVHEKNTHQFCASNTIELLDWSQDGSKIIYECYIIPEYRQKQSFSIYSYDVESQTTKQLFDGKSQDLIWEIHSASISPNNALLLINGTRQDYIQQIFLLDLSNGSIKLITNEAGYHSSALVWKSDNNTFYAHKQNDQSPYEEANFIMNIDGDVVTTVEVEGTIIR